MKTVVTIASALAAMMLASLASADEVPATPSTSQPIQTTTTAAVGTTQLTSSDDVTAMPTPSTQSTTQQNETITLKQTFHPNRPMLITGGALFVGAYATTAALTASKMGPGENGDKTMYLPVVGPWLHLADVKETGKDLGLTIGSGVLQGVGAVLAIASVFVPEKVPTATIQAGNVKMNLAPGAAYGTF